MKSNDLFTKSGINEFDFEGFEHVNGELFSKSVVPQVTIKHGSLVFNAHAIKMPEECRQIQILMNYEKKTMLVRACDENLFHSVQWSKVDKNGEVIPKIIYGKPFTGKLIYEMYWKFKGTYKINGRQVKDMDKKLLEFKLDNKI
jgi:hypothetical protein